MSLKLDLSTIQDQRWVARRLTWLLFVVQCLGSAGFIAAATVSTIVGAELSGHPSWAGVPTGVYQFSSALASFCWGMLQDRLGRRGGLALGLLVGVVGSAIASGSVVVHVLPTFLFGIVFMGAANAALQLARFSAAEIHPPAERGRAISNVVIGGTAGAVFGPFMVGVTGGWAEQAGVDELAGPYSVGLVLFAIAAVLIFFWLRPDPRDLGREVARLHPTSLSNEGPARTIPQIFREPGALVAMVAMVFGQVIMVMLMGITALFMKENHHSLTGISGVVSAHTLGMYAFSIVTGKLTDRWGRGHVIVLGGLVLVAACVVASTSAEFWPLAIALFLIGLGWNLCYVGGSALLSDQLSPLERSRTQGFNDLMIGLVSAFGAIGSGVVFAGLGYRMMSLAGIGASFIPLSFGIYWLARGRKLAAAR